MACTYVRRGHCLLSADRSLFARSLARPLLCFFLSFARITGKRIAAATGAGRDYDVSGGRLPILSRPSMFLRRRTEPQSDPSPSPLLPGFPPDCRPLHTAPHSEFCFRRWRIQLAEDPASNACCARNTMPYACEPRCSQLRPDHWQPQCLWLHPRSTSSAICTRPSPSPSPSPALLSSLFSAFSPRSVLLCSPRKGS